MCILKEPKWESPAMVLNHSWGLPFQCIINKYFLLLQFLLFHGANLCGESEEIDKAFGVMVIIEVTGGKGCDALIVQRIWRGGAGLDDISFVKFKLHFTGNVFLGGLNKCLYCLAQRAEPFSLINDLSQFVAHVHLHGIGVTVEDQLL